MFTIKCNNSRRPSHNTLGGYLPAEQKQSEWTKVPRSKKKSVRRKQDNHGPAVAVAQAPRGAWGSKMTVNKSRVQEKFQPRRQQKQHSRQNQKPKFVARPCAYCKEMGHHIKHCPKLAEKNRRQAEYKRRAREEAEQQRFLRHEEELTRQFQEFQEECKRKADEVVEKDNSSDDSDDEEFWQVERAIKNNHVAVRPKKRVTFAEKLTIEVPVKTQKSVEQLRAEIAQAEKELKMAESQSNGSWADEADISDAKDELDTLRNEMKLCMELIAPLPRKRS